MGKVPQENSYRIFYSLKYIPYTHSTCRIYSLLVPGILESRMSQETASYWQSPSSRENPQKKPQENSYRIFYSLKYIPYTHSTCRIYSLLVPGILESRISQETASYWQSPSSREKLSQNFPLFCRKRLNRAWTYLRCDRKLQRLTQTNMLQPKRCHQLAF